MVKLNNPFQTDYRLLPVENTQEAVFVIDEIGLINYYNAQFKQLIYPKDDVPLGHLYSYLFARIAAVSENPRQTLMQLETAYTRRQQKSILSLSIVKPVRHEWRLSLNPLLIENHFMGSGGIIQIPNKPDTVSLALPQLTKDLRPTAKDKTLKVAIEVSPFITGDLSIDFARRRVRLKGQSIRLTPKEAQLLYMLAMNAGRVLTTKYLLTAIWGASYVDEAHILWTNVSRLRKKLGDSSAKPRYIVTERDGYYIALDDLCRP